MRAWFSVPIVRGIRTGVSVNLNPAARRYPVSATGAKVWYAGEALMLAGLAIWLIASRDSEGRLNEYFLLVIFMVLAVRYIFRLVVAAYFPPRTTAGQS
jgi:hypothetical protein